LPTEPGQSLPQSAKISVEVSYGPNFKQTDVMAGQTLNEVLADTGLREEIGYGSLKESNVVLIANGQPVDGSYVVKDKDSLEIIKRAGEKA